MTQRPVVNGWSQRQNRIDDLVKRIGPLDKLLFNGKTAHQSVQINMSIRDIRIEQASIWFSH